MTKVIVEAHHLGHSFMELSNQVGVVVHVMNALRQRCLDGVDNILDGTIHGPLRWSWQNAVTRTPHAVGDQRGMV